MSKSSFYHYFDSKAALFDTVVRRAMAGLAGELAVPPPEALRGPDFWAGLEELAARVLALAARGDWYADAARLFYLPDAPVAESAAVRESTAAITRWFGELLAVGRACGQVRDDLPATLQATLVSDVVRSLDRWSLEHATDEGLDPGLRRRAAGRRAAAPAGPGDGPGPAPHERGERGRHDSSRGAICRSTGMATERPQGMSDDDVAAMLTRYRGGLLVALGHDGFRVPLPQVEPLSSFRTVEVPPDRATMVDLDGAGRRDGRRQDLGAGARARRRDEPGAPAQRAGPGDDPGHRGRPRAVRRVARAGGRRRRPRSRASPRSTRSSWRRCAHGRAWSGWTSTRS